MSLVHRTAVTFNGSFPIVYIKKFTCVCILQSFEMDKDRHSLRRPYQSNTRRPLGTSQRSHGSSSQGMGNSRGHRAGAPTEHTRRSHLFPPPDSRTASSISGSSSIHDFGDYGYAQASGYTPPQMLGYPSTYQANSLPLTYNNAQPSQYSQQLYHPTRGFEQAQENLNAPSAYQHTLSTSAGASSSLLDGQPYHNLGPLQPSLTHGQALANPYIQSLTSSNDEYAQYGSTSMPESSHTQAPSLSLEQPALENVFGQEPQSELNRNRLATFDRLMRRTNTDTLDGRLKEARSSLIRLSRWLQENVGSLGTFYEPSVIGINCNSSLRRPD